jgi:ferrous iron transport protein B
MFLVDAGKMIASITIILWLLQAIPAPGVNQEFAKVEDPHDSVYGVVSESISPVFAPAGFADWRISSSLVTGFFAKEVIVGALSQSYGVEDVTEAAEEGDTTNEDLRSFKDQMLESFEVSSGGHAGLAGFAYMMFVLCYTPCMAAVAEARRVFGTALAIKQVIFGLIVAFTLSTLIFQVGCLIT